MPSMHTTHTLGTAVLSAAIGLAAAGCSASPPDSSPSPSPSTPTTASSAERSDPAKAGTTATSSSASPPQFQMKIHITIGGQRFGATLTESAATRDLLAQLPLTIDMVDHGQVEKTGPLPSPLSLGGQPAGADPNPGDVGYYAPGNDMVFYYGDQSYFPGIVILGQLDGDAAQRISELDGTVTATVEAPGE